MAQITHTIRNIETGELEELTVPQMIERVNEDRSEEWTDYDETDYLEGWEVFEGEYEVLKLLGVS